MSKRTRVITGVTIARLLAAGYILIAPLPGLLISMVFDFFDGRIFAATGTFTREVYHRWDKVLDMAGYCAEMIVVFRYGVWLPFLLLFVWRAAGYAIFVSDGPSWTFLAFPNIFEAAVLWLFLGLSVGWLWVFIVLKLVQEWALHWFVPHGGNIWWDRIVRRVLPKKSKLLRWSLSLRV